LHRPTRLETLGYGLVAPATELRLAVAFDVFRIPMIAHPGIPSTVDRGRFLLTREQRRFPRVTPCRQACTLRRCSERFGSGAIRRCRSFVLTMEEIGVPGFERGHGLDPVDAELPLGAAGQDPRLLEEGDVTPGLSPAEPEKLGQAPGRELTLPKEDQDLPADRVVEEDRAARAQTGSRR
jgi:hypothetical protein